MRLPELYQLIAAELAWRLQGASQMSIMYRLKIPSIAWLPQGTEALWRESRELVNLSEGVLILDDTTLDKPYAEKMEHVPLERQVPCSS